MECEIWNSNNQNDHEPRYRGLKTNRQSRIHTTSPKDRAVISLLSSRVLVLRSWARLPEKFMLLSTDPIFSLVLSNLLPWLSMDSSTPRAISVVSFAQVQLFMRIYYSSFLVASPWYLVSSHLSLPVMISSPRWVSLLTFSRSSLKYSLSDSILIFWLLKEMPSLASFSPLQSSRSSTLILSLMI